MLPSFDCHTLERCSTARTPTSPFLSIDYACMHVQPRRWSDSFHYCRHSLQNVFFFFIHISIQPPACHLRHCASLNAEQVMKCFSVEYSFHLSRAPCVCRLLLVLLLVTGQHNCLKPQMLNIAQVPQLVSAPTDHAFVVFLGLYMVPFLRLSLLHCLP